MFGVRMPFWVLIVFRVTSSGAGTHSVWLLATEISGKTQFPEFTAVLMLDDMEVGYYDSYINRLMRVVDGGMKVTGPQVEQIFPWIMQETFKDMREKLTWFKNNLNLTAGVHVYQRMVGCEVEENNGEPTLVMGRDAADGELSSSIVYNSTHFTIFNGHGLGFQWDAMKQMHAQMTYSNVYLPLCPETLGKLLEQERYRVTRVLPPKLHLIHRHVPFMSRRVLGKLQITCLATDFYPPNHIHLRILRIGREVENVNGGSVLPNGNGLYQMRKTLMINGEEALYARYTYTCSVSHLGNKLEVGGATRSILELVVPIAILLVSMLMVACYNYFFDGTSRRTMLPW